MEKSLKEFEDQKSRDYCSTLSELCEKLNVNPPWQQMKQPNEIKLCYVQNLSDSGPQITAAMRINGDMMLDASVKLTELGSLQLPAHIDKVSQIYEICDVVCSFKSFNAANTKTPTSFDLTLQLVITLLINVKQDYEKYTLVLAFIIEQLQLMTERSYAYSYEFLIFASIFYNISPSAYRFLRSTGNLILPCLSTIRKITVHSSLSPSNEQTEETFLFYVTQKFKFLQSNDKTVNSLIDEIHLSSFFDYRSGAIVGAAHDKIDAATSAFAFMITSIFSDFKDVVHELPARKMDAKFLFKLIKNTVESLEKIGFKVIWKRLVLK